jgi:hypothetical protein
VAFLLNFIDGGIMSKLNVLVLIIGMAMMSGCAVGNRYDYTSSSVGISDKGSGTIAVGVHDQRSYVVYGSKKPDFVGLQRGGYGNPFDVRTKSKQPFADDLSAVVANSLKGSGFEVTSVEMIASDNNARVKEKLIAVGKEKILLLTVTEWKTDTYMNVKLIYNLAATVLDAKGNVVATSQTQGEEHLGGSFMNPPAHAMQAAPIALSRKVEILLNSKEIKNALFGNDKEVSDATK